MSARNYEDPCVTGDGKTKRRFLDRREAKDAARNFRHAGIGSLRVYQCQRCGFYHLTKQRPHA